MLVYSNHRRIEHDPFEIRLLEFGEDAVPDARLGPSAETAINRVPLAEVFGQGAPASPVAVDPEDGIDEEAVVSGGDTAIGGFTR